MVYGENVITKTKTKIKTKIKCVNYVTFFRNYVTLIEAKQLIFAK